MIAFSLLQLCVALHTNAAQGHVSATGSAAWKTILLFDLNERKGMWFSALNDISVEKSKVLFKNQKLNLLFIGI